MIMKQSKEKFDFKAFGQAIKAARKAKGISRNQLADTLNIAPRYIASIENSGQHPSLQILYELVTLLDVSVDQFFFPEREQEKSTRRRQLDTMLDTMSYLSEKNGRTPRSCKIHFPPSITAISSSVISCLPNF